MINSTQVTVGKSEEGSSSLNINTNSNQSFTADHSCSSTSSVFGSENNTRRGLKRSIDPDDEDDEFDENDEYLEDDQFKDIEEEDDEEQEVESSSARERSWGGFRGFRKQRGSNRSYVLRPRTGMRRTWAEGGTPSPRGARRGRGKATTKSKYRRNTANARERDRMKEINVAFANLRGALPAFTCRRVTSMTKIKTLKLAASYIRALSDLLSETPSEESKSLALQLFQDLPGDQTEFMNCITQTLASTVSSSSSQTNYKSTSISKGNSKHLEFSQSPTLEAALTGNSKRTHKNSFNNRSNLVRPPPLLLTGSPNPGSISSPTPSSPLTPKYSSSPNIPSKYASASTMSYQSECLSSRTNQIFSYSPTPTNSQVSNNLSNPSSQINFSSSPDTITTTRGPATPPFLSSNVPTVPQKHPQLTRHYSATNSQCHPNISHSTVKLQRTHSFPSPQQHFSQPSSCSAIKAAPVSDLGAQTNFSLQNFQLMESNKNAGKLVRSNDIQSAITGTQSPHSTSVMQECSASTSYGAHRIPAANDIQKSISNIQSVLGNQMEVSSEGQIPAANENYLNITANINVVNVRSNIGSDGEAEQINSSTTTFVSQTSDMHQQHSPTDILFQNRPNDLNTISNFPTTQNRLENVNISQSSSTSLAIENRQPCSSNSNNSVLADGEKIIGVDNNFNSWSSLNENTGFATLLDGSESGVDDQDLSWEDIYWGLE